MAVTKMVRARLRMTKVAIYRSYWAKKVFLLNMKNMVLCQYILQKMKQILTDWRKELTKQCILTNGKTQSLMQLINCKANHFNAWIFLTFLNWYPWSPWIDNKRLEKFRINICSEQWRKQNRYYFNLFWHILSCECCNVNRSLWEAFPLYLIRYFIQTLILSTTNPHQSIICS